MKNPEEFTQSSQQSINTPFEDCNGEEYHIPQHSSENDPTSTQEQEDLAEQSLPIPEYDFGAPTTAKPPKLVDSARIGFIRKVYCILATQLISTVTIVSVGWYTLPLMDFLKYNDTIGYSCAVVSVIVFALLLCSRRLSRTVPINYILLSIFTLAQSILL